MDREEFASFYAASFHRLVGQLYAMTRDQGEAQDAVQEAFVRAWAHRGKIDGKGSPEAWVRVTAWRIAVSRWQRAREGMRLMRLTVRPESTAGPGPDRAPHQTRKAATRAHGAKTFCVPDVQEQGCQDAKLLEVHPGSWNPQCLAAPRNLSPNGTPGPPRVSAERPFVGLDRGSRKG